MGDKDRIGVGAMLGNCFAYSVEHLPNSHHMVVSGK